MRSCHVCFVAALIAVTAAAQTTVFTSPLGFDTIEGIGYDDLLLSQAEIRFQQVDDTLRGRAATIGGFAFRRDGIYRDVTTATARTFETTVVMSLADYSFVQTNGTRDFASSYAGPTTQTITALTLSIPSLNARPTTTPAAFQPRVPFAQPFVYDGSDALLFEARIRNVSTTGLVPLDKHSRVSKGPPGPGPGCRVLTPLGTRPMSLESTLEWRTASSSIEWTASLFDSLPGMVHTVLVGDEGPVPPMPTPPCVPLFSLGNIINGPLGTTNAAGALRLVLPLMTDPALPGMTFRLQAFTMDPTYPPYNVALSNGVTQTFPANPAGLNAITLYANSIAAPIADGFLDRSALVLRFTN